jgi:hypothetical protein
MKKMWSNIKQYNPLKPIKRDYKLWCIADQKGYTLNFDVMKERMRLLKKHYRCLSYV